MSAKATKKAAKKSSSKKASRQQVGKVSKLSKSEAYYTALHAQAQKCKRLATVLDDVKEDLKVARSEHDEALERLQRMAASADGNPDHAETPLFDEEENT